MLNALNWKIMVFKKEDRIKNCLWKWEEETSLFPERKQEGVEVPRYVVMQWQFIFFR